MGEKLRWTGLAMIVALGTVLRILKIDAAETTVVAIGAFCMVVGVLFLWLKDGSNP